MGTWSQSKIATTFVGFSQRVVYVSRLCVGVVVLVMYPHPASKVSCQLFASAVVQNANVNFVGRPIVFIAAQTV